MIDGSPYQAYLYAYPHKSSYRPIDPPVRLRDAWAGENRDALYLYIHIPFCEMRCGFCNLFTTARVQEGAISSYLGQLERQATRVRDALGASSYARFAMGGGTPTFLEPGEMERVLDVAERRLGADLQAIPGSVETSPETATSERLEQLSARGIDRISIGVQSFVDEEVKAIGRPQTATRVRKALDAMRAAGFSTLNIDLMYGLPGQTRKSWNRSLDEALRFEPEEIFLYPLYVRPLTGLGLRGRSWDDVRLELYRVGRDRLLEAGYTQMSMRLFRSTPRPDAPVYRCQEDGMVGIGVGARSYTRGLHYSSEYAVSGNGVLEVIRGYIGRDEASFDEIDYGVFLDAEDRRRRYAILSLLFVQEGLECEAMEDLPQLAELLRLGYARIDGDRLRLTEQGIERSDAIGPWLTSVRVQNLMQGYELR